MWINPINSFYSLDYSPYNCIFAENYLTMFIQNIAGWIGTPEIIIIFAALLLLFGGKKIPELMRGIGRGIREFNQAKEKVKSEIEEGMKSDSKKEETNQNSQKDD